MHDAIYEITTSPVSPEDYREQSHFYDHWFVGSIADYVNSDIDRASYLSSFSEWFEGIGCAVFLNGVDSFEILPDGREKYFKAKRTAFVEAVEALDRSTPTDFYTGSGGIEEKVRRLNDAYAEKFGTYVSSEEFETIPFDEFMRSAEVGKPYYIGGVIDYHW